jgi:hypothetical protein
MTTGVWIAGCRLKYCVGYKTICGRIKTFNSLVNSIPARTPMAAFNSDFFGMGSHAGE